MKKLAHAPRSKPDPRAKLASYMERMEAELEDEGVVFFDESKLNIDAEYLELPGEITDLTPRDLGEHLNAFTQQKVYMRTLMGRQELVTEEARRAYMDVATPIYSELSGGKKTETEKDKLTNTHPAVRPAYEHYMDCKQKLRMVELSIANVEDIIFMISREVTRRNADLDMENRNHNVSRR